MASCVISLLQKGGRTRMGQEGVGFHDIGLIFLHPNHLVI